MNNLRVKESLPLPWLNVEDCKNFPPKELKIIDQLWLKYSNGKFGFSVQKQIWLDCGGKVGEYDGDIYKKLGDKVGWRKGGNWLNYSELNFTTNAPHGQFPLISELGCVGVDICHFMLFSLFSSLNSSTQGDQRF